MLPALRRLAAFVITLGGGIVLALRLAADSIGRTTVVDDALQAAGRVGNLLSWLGGQPGLLIYGGGGLALLFGALLLAPWEVMAARILGQDQRAAALIKLGAECVDLSEILLKDWAEQAPTRPTHVNKQSSLKLSLSHAGFGIPNTFVSVNTYAEDQWRTYEVASYFNKIGVLLRDGHIDIARRHSFDAAKSVDAKPPAPFTTRPSEDRAPPRQLAPESERQP